MPNCKFTLGAADIVVDDHAVHLGIRQNSNNEYKERINERCQKGLNAFYAMVGLGVKPAGLNPLTSTKLYKKIIVPTTLYGCELWNDVTQSDINTITRHQHTIVKKDSRLPCSNAIRYM